LLLPWLTREPHHNASISSFRSLILHGELFGAVLGLLLSLAAFYLTPYVWLTLARHLTG
jgi:hypothetical protein